MKRLFGFAVSVVMLAVTVCCVSVSAASVTLLAPENTTLTSLEGSFAYDDSSALRVTAPSDAGATVAMDYEKSVNLHTARYVHLAVEATAPFNIALKMNNGSYDVYPQLAGPSWYEQFQETAPAMGEGVKAGKYVLVLDLYNYMEYNAQGLGEDGNAYLRSIHVFVKGAGDVLVRRLDLSDTPTFTLDGQPITTAVPQEVVTTAPHVSTESTQPTSLDVTAPIYPVVPDGDYSLGRLSPTVIIVLASAVVLVAATVALTVIKKKKKK